MAKKIIERYVSDLSGDDLPEGATPLRFAFDGRSYEIDLTEAEREKLEAAIKPYIAVARPAAPPRAASGRSRSTKSSGRTDGPDAKTVRAWAQENGHEVPARGRIPATVLEAYDAAH